MGFPGKGGAFFGVFITCCEDDKLDSLAAGATFHIHEGKLI